MKTRSLSLIVVLVFVISLVLSASNLHSVFAQDAPTDTPTETPQETPTPEEVTLTPEKATQTEESPTQEPPTQESLEVSPSETPTPSGTSLSNFSPTIRFIEPSSDITVIQGETITIQWEDESINDNLEIFIGFDSDTNHNNKEGEFYLAKNIPLILDGVSDKYYINTTTVPVGEYYLFFEIFDGQGSLLFYDSNWKIIIIEKSDLDITGTATTPTISLCSENGLNISEISLDGSDIFICSKFKINFNQSSFPNDFVQIATSFQTPDSPLVTLMAIPYGVKPSYENLPISTNGISETYRNFLREFREKQSTSIINSPEIQFLDNQIIGLVSLIEVEKNQRILISEYIVEAGNRVWLLRISDQYPDNSNITDINTFVAEHIEGLILFSENLNNSSTSLQAINNYTPPIVVDELSAQSDLPFPSWWNGDCNANNHSGSFPLGPSYRGVKACGPLGSTVYVYFGTGVAQYEWQCPELSKRYLYLAYGIAPYSAHGKDVVWNYTGTRLNKVNNGTSGNAPQPGDVLSYGSNTTYGHTSIVSNSNVNSSGNGSITIIEQNYSSSGTRTHTVSNWYVQDSLIVSGWLHDPQTNPPTPTPPPSSSCPNLGSLPSGYTYCETEGQTCNISSPADIAYGSGNSFTIKYNVSQSFSCSNDFIGCDPIEGTHKDCYYKTIGGTGCPVVTGEVRFYDGINCGTPYVTASGTGLWYLTSNFNDRAESIAIPSGWSVRVYKDDSETSTSKCYWATDTNMNNDVFNDSSTVGNAVTWARVFSNSDCAFPNQAPSTPTLSSPASGSSHTSTPQLCWNPSTDQDGDSITYQVNAWGPTNYTSSWISGTCLTPTTLPVGNYTWNVRAKDSKGAESGASADWTFSIQSGPPPADHSVQFYKDLHYEQGYCYGDTAAAYPNLDGCSGYDNAISSVILKSGWSVRVYKDRDLGGTSKCYSANDDNFDGDTFDDGTGVNDQVSSFILYNQLNCPNPNHAPTTPTLSNPANGSSHTNTPQLCWNASTDQDGDSITYQVNVWGTTNYTSSWISSTCLTPTTLPLGNYTWNVRAKDSKGAESGASSERTFSIIPGTSPDLIIQSITSNPQTPAIGEQVTFTIRVKNQGSGNISSPFWVDFFIDEQPISDCSDIGMEYWSIDTLSAGATTDRTFIFSGFTTSGNHTLYAFADTNCNVAESQESNNLLGPITLVVLPPGINTSIPKPTLSAPADNALITANEVKLDWVNASLPSSMVFDHYQVQVAADSGFGNIVTDRSINDRVASETLLSGNLTPNNRYYWRVRVYNTLNQYGEWSLIRSFRKAMLPPALIAPAAGTTPNNLRPRFDWQDVSGATSYQIQISKYANMSSPSVSKTVSGSYYDPTADLPVKQTLYWRVRTNGANGPSLWSEVRSFISPNPPGRPSLQSPADNALTRDYTPRLDWSTSSLPSGTVFSYYHLQVARDSGFTNMALDTNISGQSNSEYTFTANLAANTKYYWRVMAVNTQGQYRSWSSVRSFRTAILPPSLITPANNGTLNTQRPTFDWGDISGASNYQIQISKYSNMKYPLIDVNISASNYLATKNLPTGRNLYWRVRAKGTNGPSDWSAIQSFMINIP